MKELKLIGNKIKDRRHSLGYKQYELAQKVNVTPGFICNIEKGRVAPSLKVLFKICKELHTHPATLINV